MRNFLRVLLGFVLITLSLTTLQSSQVVDIGQEVGIVQSDTVSLDIVQSEVIGTGTYQAYTFQTYLFDTVNMVEVSSTSASDVLCQSNLIAIRNRMENLVINVGSNSISNENLNYTNPKERYTENCLDTPIPVARGKDS